MNTQVSVFESQVPAHAINPQSKAMQAMGGGMTGGGFGNRLSLRNSKFRFIKAGVDLPPVPDPTLDVVIFALSDSVQRTYYAGEYDPQGKEPPTCYSLDGKVPMADSPQVQSPTCATCPQNVKGSGRQGNTKACAYKKRVLVVSPYDIEGDAYALDVNGMSMFGEQVPASNLFSFKGYFEKLSIHGADIAAMVTRLSFDDAASVPKLHFSPVRFLTAEEYAKAQERANGEDVALMLADMTNEAETNAPTPDVVQQVVHAQPAPAPIPAAPAAPRRVGAVRPVARPASPAPSAAAPSQTHGVGGLQQGAPRGFPTGPAKPAGNVAQAVATPGKPVSIDLAGLVEFDDEPK